MGESVAPFTANPGAVPPARPQLELGTLRNGLGSIRNLELLIKSIKVGQKGLFAAVAAVHADCAPMIAHAVGLGRGLSEVGVDTACAERLSSVLSTSLTDLEAMLAVAVEAGRLSVAQRLKLERDLARCARELSSTLPLVSLIERASRPRPLELTPVSLVHASSAERSDQKSVMVLKGPSPDAEQCSLSVDLECAKTLVALAVALVTDGNPEARPHLGFELQPGGTPVSTVCLDPAKGGVAPGLGDSVLNIVALRLSAQSVLCAEVAARSLGGSFEYARDARRVCIYWPLS
jgi:hypothetical protein